MVVCLLLVLVTLLSLPHAASAQVFVTYDAFTGALSPDLWAGLESNTNFSAVSNTETSRAVVRPDPLTANRFLNLSLTTAHPGTANSSGEAGQGRQRLRVVRDDIISGQVAVTAFRTKVTMLAAAVTPCPTTIDESPSEVVQCVATVPGDRHVGGAVSGEDPEMTGAKEGPYPRCLWGGGERRKGTEFS
jgi:hypothetical protein